MAQILRGQNALLSIARSISAAWLNRLGGMENRYAYKSSYHHTTSVLSFRYGDCVCGNTM
jgi:hypothetical protein